MAPQSFVVGNSQEDQLARGQITPGSRTAGSSISTPRPPTKRLSSTASRLTLGDPTADFMIVCTGGRFKAHKSILITASPYFQRMLRFGGKESRENQVEIKAFDASVMKRVLEFMYTGQYALPEYAVPGGSIAPSNRYCTHRATLVDEPAIMGRVLNIPCLCAGKTSSPQHLLPHVRIYSVADYLNMERLKVLAQNKAQDVVHAHWKDEKLQMVTALKEAFSNTPDHDQGMRQVLISVLKNHISLWCDEGEVRSWLENHPQVFEKVDKDYDD